MNRLTNFGVVLFLLWAHILQAANPADIDFRARLATDTRVYHMGEPIEIEISYASHSERKYYAGYSSPSPENQATLPRISPMAGILDLRELRRDRGVAGDFLGSDGYLESQPHTQQMDLCEWYRFQKAGYYSVVVTSTEVSRVKSAEEGGGLERLTLESNAVEFEILPSDPRWDAAELSKLEQEARTAANAGERIQALRRMALLDTPASVEALVHFYLTNANGGEAWVFDRALHDSSQIDTIIPLLTRALSDPTTNVPSDLLQLLADLETRKELGLVPAYPTDPASQQKWRDAWAVRSKIHDKYVAQANALLAASIERRSGPERATAIYQTWYAATQVYGAKPLAPEALSRLEENVLAVADSLDMPRQVQFVTLAWRSLPADQILPIIRKLAKATLNDRTGFYNHEVFESYCKGWPEECNTSILQDVIETNAQMDKNVILLMREAEHPELDTMLATQLRDPAMIYDVFRSQRTGAAVLRAGSRNIVAAVDSSLDIAAVNRRYDGETEGDLIGYLIRVAPEDGEKRLWAELQEKSDSRGAQVLRTLHNVRPSEDLIPVVIKALDSPSLTIAQMAALYLAEHGPASAKDALWHRLEALWNAWQGRSAELPDVMMPAGDDLRAQSAMLERALASALAHARNWKLSSAELGRLRAGCLTQTCRDITEGKLSLNL